MMCETFFGAEQGDEAAQLARLIGNGEIVPQQAMMVPEAGIVDPAALLEPVVPATMVN